MSDQTNSKSQQEQPGDDPAAADYGRRAQLVHTALDAENELADNDRWFLDYVNEKISAT